MSSRAPDEDERLDPSLARRRDAQRDRRIFIEFACPDPADIAATVEDSLAHATRSERLRFGLHTVSDHGEAALGRWLEDPRCSIDIAPSAGHRGDRWGRHRAQWFYDGEPYVLQLDEPARFEPGWDVRYPELLAATGLERPILGHERHFALMGRADASPTRMAAHRFAPGRFCIDVPHEPVLHTDDRERLLVRAFTHGYDLLQPGDALVRPAPDGEPPAPVDVDRLRETARELGTHPVGARGGAGCHRAASALAATLTMEPAGGTS